MANFYLHLQRHEIAEQIAAMLNKYNMLTVHHSTQTIQNQNLTYYIETTPKAQKSVVVGCIGVEDFVWGRKIRHLCVLPSYRRENLASRLVKTACKTNNPIFADIRDNNIASIRLFIKHGFYEIGRRCTLNHMVITFRRN